jgi:hypothetical protein
MKFIIDARYNAIRSSKVQIENVTFDPQTKGLVLGEAGA